MEFISFLPIDQLDPFLYERLYLKSIIIKIMTNFSARKSKKNGKPAYTLLELLIAFSILVVISVMIAVPVVGGLGSKKLSTQVIEAMTDVIKAYSNYLRDNGNITLGTTKAIDVLDYLNYQQIEKGTLNSDGSYTPRVTLQIPNGNGVPDGLAGTNITNFACSDTNPCLVTQNGGLLQVNKNAIFPIIEVQPDVTVDKMFSAVVMNFDPDGSGSQPATTILLFNTGRITSAPFVQGAITKNSANKITGTETTSIDPALDGTFKYAPLGENTNSDPEYMYGFTNDDTI